MSSLPEDAPNDDVFLDNAMEDKKMPPAMRRKGNMTNVAGRKKQPSIIAYDLGASTSPAPAPNIPTRLSNTAQKLCVRFPPTCNRKKPATRASGSRNQIVADHRSRNKSTDATIGNNNGDDDGEKENSGINHDSTISAKEFKSQKMKLQELEKNQHKMFGVFEESFGGIEESHNRKIQELEENHGKKIQELEEKLETSQQEMLSLLSSLIVPQGAAPAQDVEEEEEEVTTNPTPNTRDRGVRRVRPTMHRSLSYTVFRNYGVVFGSVRGNGNDDNDNDEDGGISIEEDTFSLMMISKVWTRSWALGLAAFLFQTVLGTMIAFDQISLSTDSSVFNVPFMVDPVVRVGQFFTIILCLATQSDILTSVQTVLLLSKGSDWDVIIGEEGNKTTSTWLIRILLPNLLKFAQGLLVFFVSFVIIVQSDDIIDLLKDFTALMVLAETDNILFNLPSHGYLGQTLMDQTAKVSATTIPTAPTTNRRRHQGQGRSFCIRFSVLLCLFVPMLGGWAVIVRRQINGIYFAERYPKCNHTSAFEDAKEHFGDEVCYGGPLNTLDCAFEGEDCVNFNLAFPLCKGENRTDVQNSVGNGICEKEFMSSECDYDGGDCCPYAIINDPSFGDGKCDERMNIEKCGYDNGDCIDYNRDFPGCPHDVVFNNSLFGDGQCNGGMLSTARCGYDNKDCDSFVLDFPDCPIDELSHIAGTDDVALGDGRCDSGIYSINECGYEYGDCNFGQIGQAVLIAGEIAIQKQLVFYKAASLDGMTVALGLPLTNEDGTFDVMEVPPGTVKIFRYDNIRKMWSQLGSNIVGFATADYFGFTLNLSANGNRIMISARSGYHIYNLNITSAGADWSRVGEKIVSSFNPAQPSMGTMAANGSRVALVHSKDAIRIISHDLQHEWVINPDIGVDLLPLITQLKFNSLDASRLLISSGRDEREQTLVVKVFRFDPDVASTSWTQMGQDLGEIQHSSESNVTIPLSTAISADGNRIAISFNSTSFAAPGQVDVFDFDAVTNKWISVGNPIKSRSSKNGDGFGQSINMSSDGNLLVIGSNSPKCYEGATFAFNINECTTGSVELYNYSFKHKRFYKVPPNPASPYKNNGNILNLADLSDSSIFGLHFSMDGDGSVLSISGYNADSGNVFIEAYDLDQLFYTKCVLAHRPELINQGICWEFPPYNSEECGFSGGSCVPKPVEGYPHCFVHSPDLIGDGVCNDLPPYNTESCGFDGGDCDEDDRMPVEDYPNCFVHYPKYIGDGFCIDLPPYNTEDCGFDGGDCL